jgi:hypothetical protein
MKYSASFIKGSVMVKHDNLKDLMNCMSVSKDKTKNVNFLNQYENEMKLKNKNGVDKKSIKFSSISSSRGVPETSRNSRSRLNNNSNAVFNGFICEGDDNDDEEHYNINDADDFYNFNDSYDFSD